MSVKIMGLVWDLDLPQNEKFVLLAYADHADHNGNNIFPAVKLIMQKTGYSERSVQSITRSLEKRGLLVPDGKGPKGTNKFKYGGAIPAPAKSAGVQLEAEGVQPVAGGGATITAPEPSLTVKEPSLTKKEKILESANKTVDAILEQERIYQEKLSTNDTWPHRDKFPEPIRDLLDVFVKCTGMHPAKKDVMDWLSTGQDWIDLGITKKDIENAYRKSRADNNGKGGFVVGRPGSLTNTANACAGERRTGGNGNGPQIDRSAIEATKRMLEERDRKYPKPKTMVEVMKGLSNG